MTYLNSQHLKVNTNRMNTNLLLPLLIALCLSCRQGKHEAISTFAAIKTDLNESSQFLIRNRAFLEKDSCVGVSGNVSITRHKINTRQCYGSMGVELLKILSLADFSSIKLFDEHVLYKLGEEKRGQFVVTKYFIYGDGSTIPELFSNPTRNKEQLAENWWYLEVMSSSF